MSEYFLWISEDGLVNGGSQYYVATKDRGVGCRDTAIFDKEGRQVSDWFEDIRSNSGLVKGGSKYYICEEMIREKNRLKLKKKQAIFDLDGHQVSMWFDEIIEEGLINGVSEYYFARKLS